MSNYILALNCGSSSLKFTLFLMKQGNKLMSVIEGVVEEIGNPERSRIKIKVDGEKQIIDAELPTHKEALNAVFKQFKNHQINIEDIKSVGHRVVHGGTKCTCSALIDEDTIAIIKELFPIAPLHNPPNLLGIEVAMSLLPDVPQVAIFDTAFHGTLPEYAYRYAIPNEWYKEFKVRTYGFHGTSHMYVTKRAARFLGIDSNNLNAITAHLGNGCSISKILNGKSVDTSMGFTPLEGVIMGTRSGDIDPAIISHVVDNLMNKENTDYESAFKKVMHTLNKKSGLQALYGTNLMQDIRSKAESGDIEAEIVISIYAYRIAKYIGAYWATLPSCDALIFTAGLGENEGYVRAKVLGFLENIQIAIDEKNNNIRGEEIQIGYSEKNKMAVLVIPTDEESIIGYDALYIGHLQQGIPDVYPFEI
jgi:acetate kinase